MASVAAIFADWGTTHRRAWAVAADGAVQDHRHDDQGLLGVRDRAFETSFRGFVGDWLSAAEPIAPVVMAGMVGSKLGWREAGYLETPIAFADLARNLTLLPDLDGHPVRIVPGLVCRAEGHPDVMRGEESQLFGLWIAQRAERLCVLPGTHSKWAELRHEGVAAFRTYMTGEVYAQLSGSGTLAQLMRREAPHDAVAFRRGLTASEGASAGGLLHRLFSVRTLGLFSDLQPNALPSYLSGLLIGAELRDAVQDRSRGAQPIAVIGSPRMTGLYVEALQAIGAPAGAIEGDALFRAALLKIAGDAGLI
jgi:2-dehydro-3-deoxygalactonokinase